jgi:pyruvate dehydrogenase E2 component (dihydrolipoamide acetyltransferase)
VIDFVLPELGENVTTGDVLRVLVKSGDVISKDQSVVELETDKATIEVPSAVAGRVVDVKVKAGDSVKVGQAILTVDDGAAASENADAASVAAPSPPPAAAGGAETDEKVPGDGGLEQQAEGRVGARVEERADSPRRDQRDKIVDISRGSRPAAAPGKARPEAPVAPAAPSVRRMARELGVDIDQVAGSAPGGRISAEDVKSHAKRIVTGAAKGGSAASPAEPLPDFTRWGEVERQPMRAVRRKTAEHLAAAWSSVVHVTQHEVADITGLEELRKRFGGRVEAAGGSLTMTAIAVKIAAAALKAFPQLNSSIDVAAGEIVYKKYVGIGVAVDTDRGLLVPVIRDADTKSILEISVELVQLSEKARGRTIALEEMQGGTFSISNLGGIGGTFFTPIVNLPEVAILGISRARLEPVFDESTGQFAPRLMLPLSLSYDHRVVDGAEAMRFLRWIADAFEQPFLLALHE